MTYIEAREILKKIRLYKTRARNIRARLTEFESDMGLLQPLTANYGGCGGSGGVSARSKVEIAFERLEAERQRFMEALLLAFELEDKLAEVIGTLPEIEQEIVIGCYMDGKAHWKLANELGYEERTIRRKKNKAIHTISKML